MKISDLLEESLLAIKSNKARSGLTILGIVIGISAVVALVSIGSGAKNAITDNIESIGSNLIIVMPGFQQQADSQVRQSRGTAQTLTREDSTAILDEIDGVMAISPENSRNYQVTAKANNTNTRVLGCSWQYQEVRNLTMETGSFISDQNEKGLSKVAVLGPTTASDLFGEGVNPTGQRIKINNIYFTVIGVSQAKGGSGFTNQDDMVFVPLSSMQKFLSGDDYVSSIYIKAKDASMMPEMQEEITTLLLRRHNISNLQLADFSLMNQTDLVATASSVASTFTILLAAIAGISLLVGGIGIMNMMLTTVTERTREIGLRKAIGAKSRDISLQFLTEAVELTLIGGIVGVALGYLASILISRFSSLSTSVSLFSMVLAFSVSGLIGICFGYWPARRASKLNPITALRYE